MVGEQRRRGLSFRVKLSLVAVLVAVVPLVIVGLVVNDVNERGLSDANQDWLESAVDNVRGAAASTFDRADAVLVGIRSVLSDPSRSEDVRVSIAEALVATNPVMPEVGIYDERGERIDVIRIGSAAVTLPLRIDPPRSGTRFGAVTFRGEAAHVLRLEPLVTPAHTWWLAGQISLEEIANRVEIVAESPNRRRGKADVVVVDTDLRVVSAAAEGLVGKVVGPAELAILTGVDGKALDKGLRLDGAFSRSDGERMLGAIRTIDGTPFAVVVEIPEEVALQTAARVRRWVAAAVACAIVIAMLVGILFARRLARPIAALVEFAGDLGHRRYDRTVRIRANDELGLVGDALERAASDLAASDAQILKEQAIRTDLGRYLPRPLVDQIVERRRDISLGGERRDITVVFADVVGFTPLAERQSAETVVTMLNELFTILTEIVFKHGGMVDKFVGDCVMAIWGAPDDQPDHAQRAVLAAEDMHRWLEAANDSWRERFGFSIELAIGINSGEAVVGNFGSETRMEFTAIGDTVNVAARLEAIARPGQILVTSMVHDRVSDQSRFVSLGKRELVGRAQPLELYEIRW